MAILTVLEEQVNCDIRKIENACEQFITIFITFNDYQIPPSHLHLQCLPITDTINTTVGLSQSYPAFWLGMIEEK